MKKETKTSEKAPEVPDGLITRTALLNLAEDLYETKTELEKAKDYTDNIVQSMIDTLLVVDPDAKIKTINKATSDLLGYKEDELIGKPVATIFAEEEEEEEEEESSIFKGTRLKKLIEEGTVRDYDMKYRTKKGEVIPVSFSGSVMRDKDGKLVGIVGIARDMREIKRLMQKEKELAAAAAAAETDRKRAAELEKAYNELKSTKEELAQSEKLASIGRLAAGVAHEINNPLAITLLAARRMEGMVKNQVSAIPGSEAHTRILETIINATNRCKSIVAGLLVFSRPTMLNIRPTDMNKLIKESLESMEDRFERQKVKVVKAFAPRLPIIEADRHRLSQVFINMFTNACDAMPEGGKLRIATRLHTPDAGAGGKVMGKVDHAGSLASPAVEIEISDTGEGIRQEDLFRIFDPFVTTKEVGSGVGLGLSISYGIVKEHGGTISVSSEKGKGATFIVRLPVRT